MSKAEMPLGQGSGDGKAGLELRGQRECYKVRCHQSEEGFHSPGPG